MRIAIVSSYYYPQLGGITEHVHGQASELARRGHEVTVVTPRLLRIPKTVDADDLPEPSFEVCRVGRAFPFYANGAETLVTLGPRLRFALDRLFAERQFDVVHIHNPLGPMLPITATMRSRAPVTVGTLQLLPPWERLQSGARLRRQSRAEQPSPRPLPRGKARPPTPREALCAEKDVLMTDLRSLLARTARHVAAYREAASDAPVFPDVDLNAVRRALG